MKSSLYVCFLKMKKEMDSLKEIDHQLQEAKENRRKLIRKAMDGRTQRYISIKTGINETKLSKWINGFEDLDAQDLLKITKLTGVDFK
jgi:hypothetical protein